MRQRYKCRFEAPLVTCRHIHVPKLGVRGDRTAARADRNKRAIPAVVPRRQVFKFLRRRHPPAFLAIVDMPSGKGGFPGEAGAGIERAVRAYGVSVAFVYLAGTHVDAVHGWEPSLLRFLTKVRHLLVHELTGIADARPA